MKKNMEEYLAYKRGEIRIPSHLKPTKEVKGILYKSELMEKLTRAPIYVTQTMWLLFIGAFAWYNFAKTDISFLRFAVFYFSGMVTWTFLEYIIHRFVYHTETENDSFIKLQFTMHTIHHQHPKDADRLAMPPLPGILLAVIFFSIFYLILGRNVLPFFPGFVSGYLLYITLHYYQHIVKSPMYKPWQKLWQHHKAHHYSNPYRAFGVTTRLWDWVFGTMPVKGKKEIEEIA